MTPFLNNLGLTISVDVTAHVLFVLFQNCCQSHLHDIYNLSSRYSMFLKGSLHEKTDDFKRQKAKCCLAIEKKSIKRSFL